MYDETDTIKFGQGVLFGDSLYMRSDRNNSKVYYEMKTVHSCDHDARTGNKFCPQCGRKVHEQNSRHWLIFPMDEIEELFNAMKEDDPELEMITYYKNSSYTIFIGHIYRQMPTHNANMRITLSLVESVPTILKEQLTETFGHRLVNPTFAFHAMGA